MKTPLVHSERNGFTLVELLVVIVVIVILLAMLLPASTGGGPHRAPTTACMSQQKQVAISVIMFSVDNAGRFPW
jgi:prepilin-type N-terminal cleavage/methylation domain-containing protein